MRVGTCTESLASALYQALAVHLPPEGTKRPREDQCEVFHFLQTWGDTALGFPAQVAGQAFSSAYTTVVLHGRDAAVYFNGRFAYVVLDVTDVLMGDIERRCVEPVDGRSKYRKAA
jgi:hypothetical protein